MSSGPKSLGILSQTSFLHLCCLFGCVHLMQDGELALVFRRLLLTSRNHPVFLTRPTCNHHVPHIPRLCPPCVVFLDLLSSFFVSRDCHHVVLLRFVHFRESITTFVFASHTHLMARHTLSAVFSLKKQFHLLPCLSGHNARSCLVGTRPTSHLFIAILLISKLFLLCPKPIFTSIREDACT